MRFRSKPAEIEAEQFISFRNLPRGVWIAKEAAADAFYVTTAQGRRVRVGLGEWIVAEPDGRGHYPVADDIFKKRWEPIDSPLPKPSEEV